MIRTALVGVGSCASSLVQAIHFSRKDPDASGVAYPLFGGYRIGDIDVVAAFDVDRRKVGEDLAHAVFAEPELRDPVHRCPFHRGDGGAGTACRWGEPGAGSDCEHGTGR